MLKAILTKTLNKDIALLLLRVMTGVMLMHHGYEKIANIDNFADAFVRPLHLPFPEFLSWTAAISEIGGSWLLIIGLGTRLGAIAITGTISVAIYHAIITSGLNIYLLELLVLYLSIAAAIFIIGPGEFSLDEIIVRVMQIEDENQDELINKFNRDLKTEEGQKKEEVFLSS